MTCKDCIHYDACNDNAFFGDIDCYRHKTCEHFKDKALMVELPCKVGTPVFIVNKTMGYIHTGKFRLDDLGKFGERVFLSKAKAEKVLKVG